MPHRSLSVTLGTSTLQALLASKASLYACRAVRSTDAAGVPLVWQRQSALSPTITLTWADELAAWTSTQGIGSSSFVPGFQTPMKVGQTLSVSAGGSGEPLQGGTAGAVSFQNTTTTPYSCGLATSGCAMFCAYPLHGSALEVLTPLHAVLVWFGNERRDPGDVATKCTAPALFVRFAGATVRSVTYDIDKGWDFGRATWATAVDAGTPVASEIIRRSPTLLAQVRGRAGRSLLKPDRWGSAR